jgi:HSP20 family protein
MTTKTERESRTKAPAIHPPVDIREEGDGIRLVVEMPGVVPGTISVSVDDDVLSIAADKAVGTFEGHRMVHREISRGRYSRSFSLSRDLSRDGVTADYRDGLLTVSLPKADHTIPRKIDVRTV